MEAFVCQLSSEGQLVLLLISFDAAGGSDACRTIPGHVLMPAAPEDGGVKGEGMILLAQVINHTSESNSSNHMK